ncbi:2-C-methyl-D-erythritol 4-phosphate cytidylyltransferase, partial [Ralstonia pseudosolanacearum]|uniref:2-C-methyl-D-erythritol 4-phosphate cytidylyltransferase n=1 Tax=Ralstonia pseudosolanacearum TaxID=1310165 RepID=UPI003CF9461F
GSERLFSQVGLATQAMLWHAGVQTVPRGGLWQAQTPQMFPLGLLQRALSEALTAQRIVTDEASAIEAAGHRPLLVAGALRNFKVTYPDDFALAEAILAGAAPTQEDSQA